MFILPSSLPTTSFTFPETWKASTFQGLGTLHDHLPEFFHPQPIHSVDARSTYHKAWGEAPVGPPPQGSQAYKPLQVEEGLLPLPVLPSLLSHLCIQRQLWA